MPDDVIHDIGYRHYDGPRLGRGYVLRSLIEHGPRTAFGLGRTAKAKIFPWFVVGVVGVTAAVLGVVRSQVGPEIDEVIGGYVGFVDTMSWLVIFFVAVAAPELVSRDLRGGVLPLYTSRPLRPADYPLAKLAALTAAVWLLLGAPQLLMFAIVAVSADGPSAIGPEALDAAGGLMYAVAWAAVFAALGLLLASLSGRRAFAAGGIVAVFLLPTPVVAILALLPSATLNALAGLISPVTLVQGVRLWVAGAAPNEQGLSVGEFGPLYGVVAALLVAGCVALLLARYRKVART